MEKKTTDEREGDGPGKILGPVLFVVFVLGLNALSYLFGWGSWVY